MIRPETAVPSALHAGLVIRGATPVGSKAGDVPHPVGSPSAPAPHEQHRASAPPEDFEPLPLPSVAMAEPVWRGAARFLTLRSRSRSWHPAGAGLR